MIEPIDIFITCFNRSSMTEKTLTYLNNRTNYPHRLFVIDNGSTDNTSDILRRFEKKGTIFHWVKMSKNVGIHAAWNLTLGLVASEYMITADNDLYVPDLQEQYREDWLSRLVRLARQNPLFAAIALQPHTYLGAKAPEPVESGVAEVSHCGAVFRIMPTQLVKQAGGWEKTFDSKRNTEEKTICSRLRDGNLVNYKVGYATDYGMKCYHDFGTDDNWGYEEIHPHEHGHRIPGGGRFAKDPEKKGEIWPNPNSFSKNKELYDEKTWEVKKNG